MRSFCLPTKLRNLKQLGGRPTPQMAQSSQNRAPSSRRAPFATQTLRTKSPPDARQKRSALKKQGLQFIREALGVISCGLNFSRPSDTVSRFRINGKPFLFDGLTVSAEIGTPGGSLMSASACQKCLSGEKKCLFGETRCCKASGVVKKSLADGSNIGC